jgi:hypothetical protein
LYDLFDKFGESNLKEKFMEVVSITEIGKMLSNERKAEGKAELVIKLLIKKFKSVPSDYKEKIKKLSAETIDVMATDIFVIKNLEEIEKYFEKDK